MSLAAVELPVLPGAAQADSGAGAAGAASTGDDSHSAADTALENSSALRKKYDEVVANFLPLPGARRWIRNGRYCAKPGREFPHIGKLVSGP